MTTATLDLTRSDLIVERALIGGEWMHAADGRTFVVRNPADAQVLAEVPDCGPAEAARAVDAAEQAFVKWRVTTAKERSNLLKAWFAKLIENKEDLARLISAEQGKPLSESRVEAVYGASFIEWFAEEAKRAYGEVIPETVRGRKLLVLKEPVGIVAAVTPWNFPLAMLTRKLGPALAAGCTVVAKPAEDTPLSALAVVMLAGEAGIPPGVLNVVSSTREHAAAVVDVWMSDPRVRKVTFTGSTAVGKHLMRGAADTLKRVSLELGGNAPFIVFDDADLDKAVEGAIASKFRNTGQTCVCANRILVQDRVFDAFGEMLAAAAKRLKVGAAWEEGVEQGPLINDRALAKVERHVEDAVSKGARVLTGGARHSRGGTFFQPTVLAGATPGMTLANEETFGPVAPLFRFKDEEEAIRLANATPFGLIAYFYARDLGRVWRVATALECGMVGINEGIIANEVTPFGGVKESGFGREGGRQGLDEFLNLKYVAMGGLAASP
jgi:succinate-semialdehyde dehydrogenase/glutarate-semialdehyde dehydrogenase